MAEKDLQLIDGYLLNKLSRDEKAAFEKRLQTEPGLQKELQFQQQLIEGVRHERVMQLKTMLNNVPVSGSGNLAQGMTAKIIAGLLATGLVASGLYWFLSRTEDTEIPAANSSVKNSTQQPISSTADSSNNTSGMVSPTVADVQEDIKAASETARSTNRTETDGKVSKPSAIDQQIRVKEAEALKVVSSTFVTSSREVITENTTGYNFHYSFSRNKLILHGSFEPNQYQILEFITKDNHVYILEYKKEYYLLDVTVSKPTLLSPIRDKNLNEKMSSLRK